MHTDKLLHTLAAARREVQAIRPDPTLGPHPGGLTFTRAAFLAGDPRRWTASERHHADGCRLCARLAERIRGLVHPSWSALADHAAGRLDSRAARTVDEHTGHCPACARRLAELKSKRDAVLRMDFACPLPLTEPVEFASADRRWQGRLSRQADDAGAARLLLEVRMCATDPGHRLVGVLLRGPEGRECMRFLVVRADPAGSAAHTAFDVRQLSAALGPQLESVTATALDATQLTPEDRAALLDSLPDTSDRAAWCAWLNEAAQDRALSDEIRHVLQDATRRLSV